MLLTAWHHAGKCDSFILHMDSCTSCVGCNTCMHVPYTAEWDIVCVYCKTVILLVKEAQT